MHAKASNFDGFMENISAVNKSINYFTSDKYVPLKNVHIPYLICPVEQPTKKHKVKIKKKNEILSKTK